MKRNFKFKAKFNAKKTYKNHNILQAKKYKNNNILQAYKFIFQ